MEPIWLFSAADNSIDIIGAIIFAAVAYRAGYRLYHNDLNVPGKILLWFLLVISVLHIIQVIIQVVVGGPIEGFTFRMWDAINYLTAILFIMGVERINIRERYKKCDT